MIGMDAETATPRLTFGLIELADGVPIMVVTVDMLALTEMLIQAQEYLTQGPDKSVEPPAATQTDRMLSWPEVKSIMPTTLVSSGVGIVAGIVPGLGPTVASFLSYALAKRWAQILKRPRDQKFGAIFLDNAAIDFAHARDGRGEGLAGIGISVKDKGTVLETAKARGLQTSDTAVMICGTRFELVDAA